jgi:hypothetical protein
MSAAAKIRTVDLLITNQTRSLPLYANQLTITLLRDCLLTTATIFTVSFNCANISRKRTRQQIEVSNYLFMFARGHHPALLSSSPTPIVSVSCDAFSRWQHRSRGAYTRHLPSLPSGRRTPEATYPFHTTQRSHR